MFQIPEGTFGTARRTGRGREGVAVSNPRRNVWNPSTRSSATCWLLARFKSQKERLEHPPRLAGRPHRGDVSNPRRNVWNLIELWRRHEAELPFQIPEGTFGTSPRVPSTVWKSCVFQIPEGTFGTKKTGRRPMKLDLPSFKSQKERLEPPGIGCVFGSSRGGFKSQKERLERRYIG